MTITTIKLGPTNLAKLETVTIKDVTPTGYGPTQLSVQNCNSLQDEGFAKLIIRAYENPDSPFLKQLRSMLDMRRYRLGKNYQQDYDLAHRVTGIEAADWEALLQLIDEIH